MPQLNSTGHRYADWRQASRRHAIIIMVEFNVIEASILKGWLFHPHGRTSRFGAKSSAPLHYRSNNEFAITYGNTIDRSPQH